MRWRGSVLETKYALDICLFQSQIISTISVAALVYSARMNDGILAVGKRAVGELLHDLDDRERTIIMDRVLPTGRKKTLQQLANQYSLTRERTRQIEKLVVARVRKRATNCLDKSLARIIAHVGSAVGVACPKGLVFPESITKESLKGTEISSELVLRVVLWLAGPYEEFHGWLVLGPEKRLRGMTKKILRRMTRMGPAKAEAVMTSVSKIGIHGRWCSQWVSDIDDVRIFGDHLVLWKGSLSDKAYAVIRVAGKPLAIADICQQIGGEFSRRTISNYLHGHQKRFRKCGPDLFSLAEWGGKKYTSIRGYVLKQIEFNRGTVKKDALIRTTCSDLAVSKKTVVSVLASPIFIHSSSGHIRIRVESDPVRKGHDIEITKHCYRLLAGASSTPQKGFWSYRLRVTSEILRGSGIATSPVFGLHLGIKPGKRVRVSSSCGKVSFSWTMPQPSIGSLQRPARSLKAAIGDRLFLIAVGVNQLQFRLVRSADIEKAQNWQRLCLEVSGVVFSSRLECIRSVAFALGVDGEGANVTENIRLRLEARRERDLIDLIPKNELDGHAMDLEPLLDYVSGV